jgi:hypothetical protein
MPSCFCGEESKSGSYPVDANSPASVTAFLRDHQPQNLVAVNFIVSFTATIPAGYEEIATFSNNSVSFEFAGAVGEDDIADSQLSLTHGLDVQNFSILNCGKHAATSGLKAED